MTHTRRHRGFTLVELLVVIAIIAILIGILLPTLSRRRKSANSTKCLSAMRQIAVCFTMYGNDNKFKFPVVRYSRTTNPVLETLKDGTQITAMYWEDFLLKYTTKQDYFSQAQAGTNQTESDRASLAHKSIFWGCPEWQGSYVSGNTKSIDGTSFSENGYGYNVFPMYNAKTTIADYSTYKPYIAIDWQGVYDNSPKCYHSLKDWSPASDRCLVTEAALWFMYINPVDATHTILPQGGTTSASIASGGHELTPGWNNLDRYRHGKYPKIAVNGVDYDDTPRGAGRVGFNMLYADGHAVTLNSIQQGYRGFFLRDP